MSWLLARATLSFLLLPGVVGFLVPWWIAGARGPAADWNQLGLLPLAAGLLVLFWSVGLFYARGRGTLAPWDPPRQLVVTGLYRFSRNPMYVGVSLILWGWALLFRSRALVAYAVIVMIGFHLRVVLGEEPWLASTHGGRWDEYAARVPRWLGRPRR